MNLPNRLTVARTLAIPAIVVMMMIGGRACGLAAVALFAAASFTDYLDGHIARARGLVTDFGKFMDPIADKLLVTAVMIMMVEMRLMAGWVLILFVAREFVVSGLRMVAAGKGVVLAAGKLGKAKTVCQMAALIVALTLYYLTDGAPAEWMTIISQVLIYVALALSVWSGADYLVRNRALIGQM